MVEYANPKYDANKAKEVTRPRAYVPSTPSANKTSSNGSSNGSSASSTPSNVGSNVGQVSPYTGHVITESINLDTGKVTSLSGQTTTRVRSSSGATNVVRGVPTTTSTNGGIGKIGSTFNPTTQRLEGGVWYTGLSQQEQEQNRLLPNSRARRVDLSSPQAIGLSASEKLRQGIPLSKQEEFYVTTGRDVRSVEELNRFLGETDKSNVASIRSNISGLQDYQAKARQYQRDLAIQKELSQPYYKGNNFQNFLANESSFTPASLPKGQLFDMKSRSYNPVELERLHNSALRSLALKQGWKSVKYVGTNLAKGLEEWVVGTTLGAGKVARNIYGGAFKDFIERAKAGRQFGGVSLTADLSTIHPRIEKGWKLTNQNGTFSEIKQPSRNKIQKLWDKLDVPKDANQKDYITTVMNDTDVKMFIDTALYGSGFMVGGAVLPTVTKIGFWGVKTYYTGKAVVIPSEENIKMVGALMIPDVIMKGADYLPIKYAKEVRVVEPISLPERFGLKQMFPYAKETRVTRGIGLDFGSRAIPLLTLTGGKLKVGRFKTNEASSDVNLFPLEKFKSSEKQRVKEVKKDMLKDRPLTFEEQTLFVEYAENKGELLNRFNTKVRPPVRPIPNTMREALGFYGTKITAKLLQRSQQNLRNVYLRETVGNDLINIDRFVSNLEISRSTSNRLNSIIDRAKRLTKFKSKEIADRPLTFDEKVIFMEYNNKNIRVQNGLYQKGEVGTIKQALDRYAPEEIFKIIDSWKGSDLDRIKIKQDIWDKINKVQRIKKSSKLDRPYRITKSERFPRTKLGYELQRATKIQSEKEDIRFNKYLDIARRLGNVRGLRPKSNELVFRIAGLKDPKYVTYELMKFFRSNTNLLGQTGIKNFGKSVRGFGSSFANLQVKEPFRLRMGDSEGYVNGYDYETFATKLAKLVDRLNEHGENLRINADDKWVVEVAKDLVIKHEAPKFSKYQGLSKEQIRNGLEFHHTNYRTGEGKILTKELHQLWHDYNEGRKVPVKKGEKLFYNRYRITTPNKFLTVEKIPEGKKVFEFKAEISNEYGLPEKRLGINLESNFWTTTRFGDSFKLGKKTFRNMDTEVNNSITVNKLGLQIRKKLLDSMRSTGGTKFGEGTPESFKNLGANIVPSGNRFKDLGSAIQSIKGAINYEKMSYWGKVFAKINPKTIRNPKVRAFAQWLQKNRNVIKAQKSLNDVLRTYTPQQRADIKKFIKENAMPDDYVLTPSKGRQILDYLQKQDSMSVYTTAIATKKVISYTAIKDKIQTLPLTYNVKKQLYETIVPLTYTVAPKYAPSKYAPSKYEPSKYAPSKYAPSKYEPSKYAPSKYAPYPYKPSKYIKEIPKLILPKFTWDSPNPKGYEKAVNGLVRVKGKIREIKLKTTPRRAMAYMINLVDNTTARSFDLKVVGITRQKDLSSPVSLRKFRLKKIKGSPILKLVERSTYTIDTSGEKRGLSTARLMRKRYK